jgi:AraC family transcriptional regulator
LLQWRRRRQFRLRRGVEVADFSDLPREFSRVRIPEQHYVVFAHTEHISTIRRTVNTIWNHWLPQSPYELADAPNFECL